MSEFIKVAAVSDFTDPSQQLFEVDDTVVVILHVGKEFFCLDDVCTHDGGPLSDGSFDGDTIACPRHGAKFDIRTGKALTMPATTATRRHDVEVRDGWVYVRLQGE